MDAIRRTNPTKTTKEITGTYNERFTVHVTYRCPARDEKQGSKVLFSLGIQNPDGGSDNSSEDERFMVAGQGIIPAGMENQWAVSHGRITLGFTEDEDPPGTYILRVIVVDALSKKQVVRTTKMHLMASADKDKS